MRVEAFAPDRSDAVDVGLRAGPDLEAGMMRLQVHRQRRAQVGEAGMHLAADRAAMRARGERLRQQAGLGQDLVQIFGDRQRVPDLDAVMGEAGHQEGRRQQQQFGAGRGVVAGDSLLLEFEAGHLAQQPAAQRPGAVVLAGDGEGSRVAGSFGHGASIVPIRQARHSASLAESYYQSIVSRGAKTRGRCLFPRQRSPDFYLAVQHKMF